MLTETQIAYLRSQPLGRLATVQPNGQPQNNPVGLFYNDERGTIDIGGHQLGESKKFRNLATNRRVSVVIDDVVSFQPWTVRMLEIRGTAEALTDQEPPRPGFSRELIRITPKQIRSFGL